MLEDVRAIMGVELSDDDAKALAAAYASLARGVAAFPADDVRNVEPPLRSIPGPVPPIPEQPR
jgi:hypothetical protein